MPKSWEQMSADEKIEELHKRHSQEIADLRYRLGHLEQRVQLLERTQQQRP